MKLSIYDNTLRDGEQAIGVSYNKQEKIDITKMLVGIGLTKIEVGFISVSCEERDTIGSILKLDLPIDVFCLSRLMKEDIDLATQIGVRNVTVFTCSSDKLMKYKLHKSEDELVEEIKRYVSYCKEHDMYVRFSCEDATNTPIERLIKFYSIAHSYGADYASVPDTFGIAYPKQIAELVSALKQNLRIPLSIHCHNDLGLATANCLEAINAGIDEVQTTVNGMGERVGNASFEEVVLILHTIFKYDLGIDIKKINDLSQLVSKLSRIPISDNKPIIGKNAFCHESGLHVKEILQTKGVYEPFPPEIIGRNHEIAFGKHSGRSNVEYMCKKMNMEVSEFSVEKILQLIKDKSHQKFKLSEEEVIELIQLEIMKGV